MEGCGGGGGRGLMQQRQWVYSLKKLCEKSTHTNTRTHIVVVHVHTHTNKQTHMHTHTNTRTHIHTTEPHDKLHLAADLDGSEPVHQEGEGVDVGCTSQQNQDLEKT